MSYLYIIFGAILWGTIGVFVRSLQAYGFSAFEIVAIRVIAAGLILLSLVLFKDRSLLKIKLTDTKYFIGTGIFSIVFFNWCYFTTMRELSLSVAVVLLYTAPAFVAIISRFVFKEPLNKTKLSALFIMILGCYLVAGGLSAQEVTVSGYGLLVGLGSGLGYALYSIFGKLASKKYSSLTITTYTFIFASLIMIPFGGLYENVELLLNTRVLLTGFTLGLIPTTLAYLLYTAGLSKVETGQAAIIANVEPVAAMIIGVGIYGDKLTVWQIVGSILILSAAVLVQTLGPKSNKP